jgi:UDP-N-acetylmuramoyl-L-alanyl-D-glutamate--2,6-diaminopimelate ligase
VNTLSPLSQYTGITDDSRQVIAGNLFIVRGKVEPKYIEMALANGAKHILTPVAMGYLEEIVIADFDSTHILESFYGWQKPIDTMIAITGTNGKTTISYLIHQILKQAQKTSALFGTIKNVIDSNEIDSTLTTPGKFELYSLLNEAKQKKCDTLVMEASSHALDQGRLGGLKFDVAIFTNLSQDHLDYHGSMNEYFRAKKKLFTDYNDGIAIVNNNDSYGRELAKNIDSVWTYGTKVSDIKVLNENQTKNGFVLELDTPKGTFTFSHNLVGSFNIENLQAAIGATLAIGIEPAIISTSIRDIQIPGRLEKISSEVLDVYVDYAHTPNALERVLRALKSITLGELWCVFGCGGDRDVTKRPLMAKVVEQFADKVVLTSDNPRSEDPIKILKETAIGLNSEYVQFIDRETAIDHAIQNAQTNDVVLIAGKGHEDYQILKSGKIYFDDREVAKKILETKCN